VHEGKCELAIIDYLGRIDTDSKENIYTRVSRITGKLKDIAKANNIPIVLLCQLNRDVVNENRSPRLSDLRDSGSIEQDADIVLMLENKDDDGLTMWVRKNRQGRKDFPINLRHNDSYTVFLEE
jgi:replicative DNA helicase